MLEDEGLIHLLIPAQVADLYPGRTDLTLFCVNPDRLAVCALLAHYGSLNPEAVVRIVPDTAGRDQPLAEAKRLEPRGD